MKQFLTLAVFELRGFRRERGAVFLMAVALLLALYGLFEGNRFRLHVEEAQRAAGAQQAKARIDAKALTASYFANPSASQFSALQWYKTPIDVRGYAFREHVDFAALPPLAGASLAIGQADVRPPYVRVRAESMESVRTASEIEHPARLASGRYDLLFFVVYLWPLVLLSLCTSVLTQDRESSRLRSLLLQGVSTTRLLAAQVAARSVTATASLIAVVGVIAVASGALVFTSDGMHAFAGWAAVTALYSAFWAAVAMVVCSFSGNRMAAAFSGFGLWIVFAVVLPGALEVVTRIGAPLPTRENYVQAMRDAGDKVAADQVASLSRFYDAHPEWRPQRTALKNVASSVTRLQRAEELEKAMLDVDRKYRSAEFARTALFTTVSTLSPVPLASQAFSVVAGNDLARHQAFINEVGTHQLALREWFQAAIQRAALGDEKNPCARTCLGGYGFQEFDSVPRFQASARLLAQTVIPIGTWTLAIWAIGLMAIAHLMLRRERAHQRY